MNLKEAEQLALTMIETHLTNQGITGWTFKWHNSIKILGTCSYKYKRIMLSKRWSLTNSKEEVLDTILHEIAHAMTPEDEGHGELWKAACRKIGAKDARLYSGKVKATDVAVPTHVIYHIETGKIYKTYFRKPSKRLYSSIHRRFIKSDRAGTEGKLAIREIGISDLKL